MIDVSIKALRELGICLYDRHGEMKPLRELTMELEEAYYKINPDKKEPLLTIELQDETSVPKVFYEGKEITEKIRVSFGWITKDAEPLSGGTEFNVEYHEGGHGDLVKKRISLARGKHALDK